jgi:DNA-binding PadR family transcriptional regulator
MPDGPVRITQPLLDVIDVLLAAADGERHGWAIMKAAGRSGPTVYKILERLAEAGWLTSRWDETAEPGLPRRRYYRLTGEGVTKARAVLAQRRGTQSSTGPRLAFGGGAS